MSRALEVTSPRSTNLCGRGIDPVELGTNHAGEAHIYALDLVTQSSNAGLDGLPRLTLILTYWWDLLNVNILNYVTHNMILVHALYYKIHDLHALNALIIIRNISFIKKS